MKWLIVLLTAATGLLHILIGFNWWGGQPDAGTNWLLVLNGVGYLVLLFLYWTSSGGRRGTIRWLLLAYTLITLIGYFVINGMGGFQYTPGLITKAIELLLVILLFLDRGSDRVAVPATTTTTTATRTGGSYSVPSSSAYSAPSTTTGPSARAMTDVDATAAAAASAAAAGLGTAAAGMSAAPLAMSTAALGAAAATGDTVEETVDEAAEAVVTDDWSDRVDYAADTSVVAVHDTTEGAGEVAVDTSDWVADKAGDAVDATGDAISGAGAAVMGAAAAAGDWFTDKVDDAGDAMADAGDAVVDAGDDAADWVGDKVDDAGDAMSDAGEAVADAGGDAADWVGDKADDAGDALGGATAGVADWVGEPVDTTAVFEAADDRAGAAADWVGDAYEAAGATAGDVAVAGESVGADWVGDAYDAAGGTAGDVAVTATEPARADWVGDAYDTSGATAGEMVDAAADTMGDAVDATGAALAGAGAAVAGAVEDTDDALAGRLGTTEAAALDAEQLAAEPSPEQLRSELEEYLRSFGSTSEFRKGVEYIEGVGPAMGEKLRAAGVITVLDLMVNGATRRGRKQLSDRSGIAQSNILTWVNHIDLFRVKGVAEEYADLLEQSGVDTVVELAQRNPNNLFKKMNDINQQRELVRRMPRQADVQDWVAQAKALKRLVHY